jgi:hypothetical protein
MATDDDGEFDDLNMAERAEQAMAALAYRDVIRAEYLAEAERLREMQERFAISSDLEVAEEIAERARYMDELASAYDSMSQEALFVTGRLLPKPVLH